MASAPSLVYLLICLLAGIAVIVVLTTKYKVPAAFALIAASLLVGLGVHLPLTDVVATMKDGFGNIMKSLGFIILLGTTLGILLEHTGSTAVMAGYILKKLGQKHTVWAIGITGFIVGLPIFCDSGYIVLSGLNKRLARQSGISILIMSVSLATGLYAVHCMVPPHPGSAAAAGIIGVDIGRLILAGTGVAIPAMIAGNLWARYAGKKYVVATAEDDLTAEEPQPQLSVIRAFLPVMVPIILIAAKSFVAVDAAAAKGWPGAILSIGDPVIALMIGVLLAFNCKRGWTKTDAAKLLHDAAEKSGGILVIIGAGGAFGAILAVTKIGDHLSQAVALSSMGIFFPFLLTVLLKTAQGSSTVAIITAATIIQPLLPALGLDTDTGRLLCTLAMGAGSMMISHANDAYFWVVSRFSGLDMKVMLRVYSVATVIMGLVSFGMVFILSRFL